MSTDYENNERCAQGDALKKAATGADYITVQTVDTILFFLLAVTQVIAYSSILVHVKSGHDLNRRRAGGGELLYRATQNDVDLEHGGQLAAVRTRTGLCPLCRRQLPDGKGCSHLWYGPNGFYKIFNRSFANRQDWNTQQDEWSLRHDLVRVLMVHISNFAAYAYVIYLVTKGNIGAGDFVLYFGSIYQLSFAVRNVFDRYSGFNWLSNNLSYAREYLDTPDRTNRDEGEALPEDGCEIEFRNVSYTYSGASEPTIRNISFTLHKGEKLAIVGLNGAGKTTLIKLMCGLYNPTEGEILLNGKPVNAYNREAYFTLFSTVFQDIAVLPVTIAENIAGVRKEEVDIERVYACLKQAGLYEDVMRLPEREQTRLVKSVFENATEFSGGQMQKLALARALYQDGTVLLLDEPTAALDPIAEREMYYSYADFSKGKSCVFISHRLASTRFCDRIILIENGIITETGSHKTLMQQGGAYAKLFTLQSSYYNDQEVVQDEKSI